MTENTKSRIFKTFVKLLKKRSIEKITVRDIADACGISRQTFYYHFKDILDVLEWAMEQEVDHAIRRSLKAPTLKEAIHVFVSMAIQNSDIISKLLSSQKKYQLESILLQGLMTYLGKMMLIKAPETNINISDAELKLHFYAYGIAGILMEYCRKKTVDVDIFSAQIFRLLNNDIMPASEQDRQKEFQKA